MRKAFETQRRRLEIGDQAVRGKEGARGQEDGA